MCGGGRDGVCVHMKSLTKINVWLTVVVCIYTHSKIVLKTSVTISVFESLLLSLLCLRSFFVQNFSDFLPEFW